MKNPKVLKMIVLSMLVALGVVISPILRVEGMCPMAHLINIVCSVFLGPWYSLLYATLIGIIRMAVMGIPAHSFIAGTLIGGSIAYVLLRKLSDSGMLVKMQNSLGSPAYCESSGILSNAITIAAFGAVAFVVVEVLMMIFSFTDPIWSYIAYGSLGAFAAAAVIYYIIKKAGGKKQLINKLRGSVKALSPLIHCITNPISINRCANIILAAGARPMMAEHPDEASVITRSAGAVMLNLGNFTDIRGKSMLISAQTAKEHGIPFVLDVCGSACLESRQEYALALAGNFSPAVIKGNYSEIAALANSSYRSSGVDADSSVTREAAEMTAAYLAAGEPMSAAAAACAVFGICGQLAQTDKGSGTFSVQLMDALSTVTDSQIQEYLDTEEIYIEKT